MLNMGRHENIPPKFPLPPAASEGRARGAGSDL